MSMNQEISENVQESVRLGVCMDLYYYGERNSMKQCYPTTVNNKFFQAFTSLGAGSSQFLFSPNQGLTDVIVSMSLPPASSVSGGYVGCALNRGWAYSAINQVNWRYAGSSQYYVTGQQMLVANLRECNDATSRDFLFQLGGAECLQVSDFAGDNLNAYAYINLPHSTPNGDGQKLLPLPTDLLTQPVIITLIMNPIQTIFSTLSGATPPTALSYGSFQVKQVMFNDAGDMLSRREDMNVKAYSYPITFYQQEYTQQVAGSTVNPIQLNLTGFRSGQVRCILMWLTRNSDIGGAVQNPFAYQLPSNITMTYNGDIIYLSQGSNSLMWDLVSSRQWPGVSNSYITTAGGGTSFTSVPVNSYYVTLPFAQHHDQVSGTNTLVNGKAISNAIVNLSFTTPENVAYTAHFTYVYNSTLLFNRGSTDYVF